MLRSKLITFFALLAFAHTTPSRAQALLAESPSSRWFWGGTNATGPITEISIQPSYFNSSFQHTATLLQGQIFTTADIGQVFSISSANDAGFMAFAARLTDGINDSIGSRNIFGGNPGGGSSPEESYWNFLVGTVGPDLAGYTVSSIDFILTTLTFSRPGSDPNGDGNWSQYYYEYKLSVYGGAVPEPSTYGLVLGGFALFAVVWRQRRHRAAAVCSRLAKTSDLESLKASSDFVASGLAYDDQRTAI